MIYAERQPWRYRCPLCGSISISRASQKPIPTMSEAGRGRRIATSGHKRGIAQLVRVWRCLVCREHFDQPRDMLAPTADYHTHTSSQNEISAGIASTD